MKLLPFILMALMVACSTVEPETSEQCPQGGNYCQWQLSGRQAGICCPQSAPYCGAAETNCEPGRCCASIPMNLQLHPNGH